MNTPVPQIERLFDQSPVQSDNQQLYCRLETPTSAVKRPYVLINMVSTVDGKILAGQPGSTAAGLGSPVDQLLMRRLQARVDAIATGAGTLRVGNVIYPAKTLRVAITSTGDVPWDNRFFTDAPDRAIVAVPDAKVEAVQLEAQGRARILGCGGTDVDAARLAAALHEQFGVQRLLVEGGGTVNDAFLRAGIVDEFFLTVAPKLKGGAHMPTTIGGLGLPGSETASLTLVSAYKCGEELYLRYRVGCPGQA